MKWMKRLFDFFAFRFVAASPAVTTTRSENDEVLALLEAYFETNGGVASVVKRFESNGFMGKVRSWTPTGAKLSLNSVEALQLIGWRDLRRMSESCDIPVERLRELLAELIPVAVARGMSASPTRG